MNISFAEAQSSPYSARSSHVSIEPPVSPVLEERILMLTKEICEKDRLIVSLKNEKEKLREQSLPFFGPDFFKEYVMLCVFFNFLLHHRFDS